MVITTKRNFKNKLEQSLTNISGIEMISPKDYSGLKKISEAKEALTKSVRNSNEYQIGIVKYPKIETKMWGKQNLKEFSENIANLYKIKYGKD